MYEDTMLLVRLLAFAAGPKFESIIAVSRGGLFPALIIANKFNIKVVDTICVSSYTNMERRLLQAHKRHFIEAGPDTLVVDDLVDSGGTMKWLRDAHFQHSRKPVYGVVYAKPQGLPQTDFHGVQVEQDVWLKFPWEVE
jgi:xanthine phosphoribosyltransferase